MLPDAVRKEGLEWIIIWDCGVCLEITLAIQYMLTSEKLGHVPFWAHFWSLAFGA